MTQVAAPMPGFRRAFLINFASSTGDTAVRFGVSLLLARLLGPAEMGVYALALVFVNIAQVLRDFGVSAWLQREPDLTPDKIRSGLGLLCCTTVLMAIVLVVGSGTLPLYFRQPGVRAVLRVLTLGFVLIPFNAVMAALMLRDLAVARLAYVSRLGTAAYAITCLGLAMRGFGAMSLAWAYVANIVACGLAYLPLRPAGQSWRPSFVHWGGIVRFGAGSLLTQLLVVTNNALPDLLLGKLGTVTEVGLLGRASSTANLFGTLTGSAINFGALPYLANAHHRQTALAPLLNRSTALLTAVAWPVLALTGLFAGDIVLALFGPRWMACVPAVPALALVAAIGMSCNYGGAALAAIGRPDLASAPVAVTALARLALAGWLFHGDVASFAGIMLAGSLVALPLQLGLQSRCLGQSPRSMARAVLPSLMATLACGGAAWALARCLPAALPVADRLVLLLVAGLVAWYAALRVTGHELAVELHRLLRLRITIRK